MFDKVPSLKDFIIYFIPGVLTCYFALCILSAIPLFKNACITIDGLAKNSSLVFISILFSFVGGFLISQIQIIFLKNRIDSKRKNFMCIDRLQVSKHYSDALLDQVISVFKLGSINRDIVLKDTHIFELCLHYIKLKSNTDNISSIERSKNLSNFALTLNIPLIMGICAILIKIKIALWIAIPLGGLLIVLIIWITLKIAKSFKKTYRKSVYDHFLATTFD